MVTVRGCQVFWETPSPLTAEVHPLSPVELWWLPSVAVRCSGSPITLNCRGTNTVPEGLRVHNVVEVAKANSLHPLPQTVLHLPLWVCGSDVSGLSGNSPHPLPYLPTPCRCGLWRAGMLCQTCQGNSLAPLTANPRTAAPVGSALLGLWVEVAGENSLTPLTATWQPPSSGGLAWVSGTV